MKSRKGIILQVSLITGQARKVLFLPREVWMTRISRLRKHMIFVSDGYGSVMRRKESKPSRS